MRPSLSRRFALSRRMKAFLALQFARFLSSRRCSIGILLGILFFILISLLLAIIIRMRVSLMNAAF
ncbi:hypothetical protein AHAS_Ahas12G0105700 [Arachis hypogaea]